jgi:glycosyltransferase involved in cell wall biosynthesis
VTTVERRIAAPGGVALTNAMARGVDIRQQPHDVEIIIPVYNEAPQLATRLAELRHYLDVSFPFKALVTIVDNASTDETFAVATELARSLPGVAALHLPRKGRGYALRTAWASSSAQVVAYMDVDLSTDLTALLPLVAPLLSGQRDVAIGTRLARGSNVVRGTKRELISRSYNLLLKLSLRGRFSDAQCGFKALRLEAAQRLLPLVVDDEWFFDTELLVTAERLGLRMSEVPVDWVDDPNSSVQLLRTVMSDLRGVWRISHGQARRQCADNLSAVRGTLDPVTADQLFRFAGVGIVSLLGYVLLFIGCRQMLGTFAANALALAICTACNTVVHMELSRNVSGRARHGRFVAISLGLFALSLLLTTVALALVHVMVGPSLTFELLAVTGASAIAAVLRFAVLRTWVFRTSAPRPRMPRLVFRHAQSL